MIEYRVILRGVWPDLSPSWYAQAYFDARFDTESEARALFDSMPDTPAQLYVIDWSTPELSRRVLDERVMMI